MSEFPTIPGYRIERELGSGGMATVYLAVQERLNRRVAIKVLSPVLLADREFILRFLKEAQTAAGLHHSNIIPIYDVGRSGNDNYIVMEYLGESLKDRIKQGPLGPDEALDIVLQVGKGLDYAHAEGFVHRDIKPENIMFRRDGTAVLADFGIARAVDSTTKLTRTGISIGTPHYMSPEQARGKKLDGRSDIYSLGVVFYEMLTGKVPYEAEDSVAVIIKHIQDPIPELPAHLTRYQPMLNGMMAKDPEARAKSGEDISCLSTGGMEGDSVGKELDGKLLVSKKQIAYKKRKKTDQVGSEFIPSNRKQNAAQADEVETQGGWWQESVTGMEFVWVPAGEFDMGSDSSDAEDDEKPVHRVYVNGFLMGKHEVMQGEWLEIMGTNPSHFKKGQNFPIDSVSWEDVQDFIKRLNRRSGFKFRLPTKAEWEYACRAGEQDDRYGTLDEIGWYDENSSNSTHPVGQKMANAFGLYDMLGNVWEWCQDWYGGYSRGKILNPTGPNWGSCHIIRGGSWGSMMYYVRSSFRNFDKPNLRSDSLGFRLMRET